MESYHAHQLILPTDKRNPCFTLYATEDQQSIRVFYGLELMEVVPDDPDQMAFKMLAGRLYNAGVLVAKREEVFKADRKTIRAWGEAIVSRDSERLARVLLGRGVNQKRTPAIDHYVARRWPELLAEGCPNYRATLIREIESIFEVKLSGETLRQIILEIKGSCAVLSGNPPALTVMPPWHPEEEVTCLENPITTTDDLATIASETSPQADCGHIDPSAGGPDPSKCSPPNWQPRPGEAVLCDHVGMLVFADALSSIAQAASPPEPLLAQWLGSVMLGAVNIEQTKYLNWQDLGDLLGQTVRFPTSQREQLTRLATLYEQLRDQLTDRQVPNRAYLEKVKIGRQLETRQARQLLAADRAQRDQTTRQQRLEEIQYAIASRTTLDPNTSTATAPEHKELTLSDCSGRPQRLRLTRKEQISVRINDTP
jgi:hypothetical protein